MKTRLLLSTLVILAGGGALPALADDCDILPVPFPCASIIDVNQLGGTACPAGDIPYRSGLCDSPETDWLTLLGSGPGVDSEWAYEYASIPPETCPDLPYFWGPSSSGSHFPGSGCPNPPEGWNCNLGIIGRAKFKWCYRYNHVLIQGPGCGNHIDWVNHSNVDLDEKSIGAVGDHDVDILADLLGTRCGYYYGDEKYYNPVADYNRDGRIDASDLSLLAAHYEHKCSDWESTGYGKAKTLADYPWQVFDSPAMQRAMSIAGIDRDFVVRIWEQNGPGQVLFVRGERYDRESHLAAVAGQQALTSQATVSRSWGLVKVLFR
jgi:hypothetical protein